MASLTEQEKIDLVRKTVNDVKKKNKELNELAEELADDDGLCLKYYKWPEARWKEYFGRNGALIYDELNPNSGIIY